MSCGGWCGSLALFLRRGRKLLITFRIVGERGPEINLRKQYIAAMARRGELASLEEGALIATMTKATIRRWLVDAGIDWMVTRRQWLARRYARCEDWAANRPPPRHPTKEQMRRQLAQAIRRTNAAQLEKQRKANPGRDSAPE